MLQTYTSTPQRDSGAEEVWRRVEAFSLLHRHYNRPAIEIPPHSRVGVDHSTVVHAIIAGLPEQEGLLENVVLPASIFHVEYLDLTQTLPRGEYHSERSCTMVFTEQKDLVAVLADPRYMERSLDTMRYLLSETSPPLDEEFRDLSFYTDCIDRVITILSRYGFMPVPDKNGLYVFRNVSPRRPPQRLRSA
jgi:hypothetical protein